VSRGRDREDEKPESGTETSLSRSGGGQEKRERAAPAATEAGEFGENKRERISLRGREYWVRPSQREAMFDVGVFRAVDVEDLKQGIYGGKAELSSADVRSLIDQKLARGLWMRGKDGASRQILSLTEEGVRLLKSRDPRIEREDQVVYSGHVKIAELEHDSLLYRAYLLEKARLGNEGGSIRRVVLDYELKKALFSRPQKHTREKPQRQESARALSLPVVGGHVMLPDFRIEYEGEQGERGRVDIEVATGNYRQAHMAAKAQAGFRIYAPRLSAESGGYLKGNIFKDRGMTVFDL
jgi:hypothetical protein